MIFSQFAKYPNLKYGFSSRTDGSMHRRLEKRNREEYFDKIGVGYSRVVTADSVHGATVSRVSGSEAGKMIMKTDGLITDSKNLFLSATAADCFLLYFYDPVKKAIGITHVGWRGLLAGVVENTVDSFVENFGVKPQNLLVSIGPGIRECHFEISPADGGKFEEYSEFVSEKDGKVFVGLPDIIKVKLLKRGVLAEHVEDSGICTYCNEKDYFSYRRDRPKDVQPQVGYIGLK
ncbi:MAG: polyphenol oxidase family protein [Candidatus Brennerbacteria bacterium]|nr:polyphenol oxidase family protein [Candidatus Brennerbacteria bacterium]